MPLLTAIAEKRLSTSYSLATEDKFYHDSNVLFSVTILRNAKKATLKIKAITQNNAVDAESFLTHVFVNICDFEINFDIDIFQQFSTINLPFSHLGLDLGDHSRSESLHPARCSLQLQRTINKLSIMDG